MGGRTALHWAAVCKSGRALAALVKYGAHCGRKDSDGRTALDYAKQVDFLPAIALLEQVRQAVLPTPRLGPAAASTSLRAYELPQGYEPTPSDAARLLFRMLSIGCFLGKFAHSGRGQLQQR